MCKSIDATAEYRLLLNKNDITFFEGMRTTLGMMQFFYKKKKQEEYFIAFFIALCTKFT